MICTQLQPSNSGASTSHQPVKQREHYLHSRELTLDFGCYAELDISNYLGYDERGRQYNFRETAWQRQERLNFVRRQKRTHRLCKIDLQGMPPSGCTTKDVVPHRFLLRPIERTQAATKIQRAYRAHRAIGALKLLERRIVAASDPSHDARATHTHLRARAAELGALGAFLDAAPHTTDVPRVLHTARRVTETLRRALEQAECAEQEREEKGVRVHARVTDISAAMAQEYALECVSLEDEQGDLDCCNARNDFKRGYPKALKVVNITTSDDSDERYCTYDSSDSESSDYTEEDFDLSSGASTDEDVSEAHRAALVALYSGSAQHRQWIARVLAATPPHRIQRHSTVSKVPALLTISEDPERNFS